MAVLTEGTGTQRGLVARLLGWRTECSFGLFESIVLSLYGAVLATAIASHEPWGDEAQAWLIARDSSIWELLRHRLHYEGAPGLWHLLLAIFQRLGGTYPGMNWMGGIFALGGVFVLLRWSPFPLLLRALLPFTFFLLYQYAVVARGYTLFPLLVFALCALFPFRKYAIAVAIVAGLLANLSMHGVVVGTVLFLLYAWEHRRRTGAFRRMNRWQELRPAVLIFLAFVLCAGVVAVPAPDDNFFAVGTQLRTGFTHDLLVNLIGQPTARLPFLPQPFTPDPPRARVDFLQSPADWAVWYTTCDESSPSCTRTAHFAKPLVTAAINLANQATWPIATSKLTACIFLTGLGLWLKARRGLRFAVPALALLLLGQVLWSVDHHSGMFFVALIAAAWLAYASSPTPATPPRFDRPFVLLFTLVAALQVGWSVFCIRSDIHGTYDPGREAAAYLQKHPVPRAAAFQYFNNSMQPYFARNPFFNLPSSYWLWSSVDNPDAHFHDTIATHPDLVVFSVDFPRQGLMENEWAPLIYIPSPAEERTLPGNPIVADLRVNGYRETHRFCGNRFMRLGISMGVCDIFFELNPGMQSGSSAAAGK